jgi:uncharacterized protein YecE (DUF72 family)
VGDFDVRVGTSGWIYPHWKRTFYPPGLPGARWLGWLAERFDTVEINTSFYRLQTPACFDRWRASVPERFEFAVKGSRYITHMLKLGVGVGRGGRAPLANFFAQGVLRLGRTLGPILWQLPPMLGFHAERARAFFDALPRDVAAAERLARRHDRRLRARASCTAPDGRSRALAYAVEVRHASWASDEARALVEDAGVALVTADTAGRWPLTFALTAPLAYVRLHGSRRLYGGRYTDDELDDWARLARGFALKGARVRVYFDNDEKAYAPGDALRLRERLAPGQRAQRNPMSMSR